MKRKRFIRVWKIFTSPRLIDEIRFVLWYLGGREHFIRIRRVCNPYLITFFISFHLSESTKFDLFHDVWLEENILEHWETFPHLFGFDLGVTILMAIMRISLKSPISKHSHIFCFCTPNVKLILLYSSLTSRDYFRNIGMLWLTFQ